MNECLPAALARIPEQVRPTVTHQAGKQQAGAVCAAYGKGQVEAEVLSFIDDMPRRYAQADLVVCRAGAITVSELTAAGVASVLVPLMVSTTSHQRQNAVWMADQKAAIHLPQSELTVERLAELLQGLTRERCLEMASAAHAIGKRDANQTIANVLEELAGAANKS
ncbi:glycosyltransferase [Undibacterium arcticum]